jgi:hypothetical protein
VLVLSFEWKTEPLPIEAVRLIRMTRLIEKKVRHQPKIEEHESGPQLRKPLLVFFFAAIAVIGTTWILLSQGFYPIDEIERFLYSRFVLQALPITVQTWHRPIPQWLFALPAQLGHTFTMFFAFALYFVLLWMTYKIAVLKGIRHAEWVVILTGLQPILFDLSYACMNEVPAALMVVLSYWFYLKERHALSLTIASLGIMCRPETYVFAVILIAVYAWKRKWKLLPIALVGPLLWIISSALISGNSMTFFSEWAKYSKVEKYIPGVSLSYYIANLHVVFGIAQMLLFIAGVFIILRAKKSADFAVMYAAIAVTIVLNTLSGAESLHWTGSVGDLRYITVIGPFIGIVAVYGWSEILENIRSLTIRAAISAAVIALIVFNCALTTQPRFWSNYDYLSIEMTREARKEYPHAIVLSNNPVVQYEMDAAPTGGSNYEHLNKETLTDHRECLILWDPYTANTIFSRTGLTSDELLRDTSMILLQSYRYQNFEYLLLYKHS